MRCRQSSSAPATADQQAKFQTPVQTLAAVGRGIGPYLGTLLINVGDGWVLGLGPPLMLIMAFISIASSILVPAAYGNAFYDPPPPKTMLSTAAIHHLPQLLCSQKPQPPQLPTDLSTFAYGTHTLFGMSGVQSKEWRHDGWGRRRR